MAFESGQSVTYERSRSGSRPTEHIDAVYVEEVQFSHCQRRHKIIVTLKDRKVFRFVGLNALK